MIDKEKIAKKLEKLREYTGYLKNYRNSTLGELKKDPTLQGAIRCYLQLAIECVIDIGELVIIGTNLRKPESTREVVEILAENEIIPKDFGKRFAPITGFRNILVHEYAEVDMEEVLRHLQKDLEDFNVFAQQIAQFLEA